MSSYPTSQSVFESGEVVRALLLKYYEIVDEQISKLSKGFRDYLSDLQQPESKEIAKMGYILREAENELTSQTIQLNSQDFKMLSSYSAAEDLANHLDAHDKLGLSNTINRYTSLKADKLNDAIELFTEDLIDRLKPTSSNPEVVPELYSRLISYGYLFKLAEELLTTNKLAE